MIGAETVAVRMVGQDFDHPAVADTALAAVADHPLEFALERLQAGDLSPALLKLPSGDAVGSGAGSFRMIRERQEFADRVQRKAELAGMAHEAETLQMPPTIAAL